MSGTISATGSSVQLKIERADVAQVVGPRSITFGKSAGCHLRMETIVSMPAGGVVCGRSAEFLGESDEKAFRPADVAEPIRVFIPDDLAYELRSALAEPLERLVDVVNGEHDA